MKMKSILAVLVVAILSSCSTFYGGGTTRSLYYALMEYEETQYKKGEKGLSKDEFDALQKKSDSLKEEICRIVNEKKEILIKQAKIGDVSTRSTAIAGLGYVTDKDTRSRVVPILVEALNDKDDYVVSAAAGSLGMIADESTPLDKFKVLVNHNNPNVRAAAVFVLGRILRPGRDNGFFDILVKALDDGYGEVRRNAVLALGAIGKKEAIKPIVDKVLKDKFAYVRESVAFVLGSFRDKLVNPHLIELLDDVDAQVVETAAESLVKINGVNFGRSYNKWRDWWNEEEKCQKQESKK